MKLKSLLSAMIMAAFTIVPMIETQAAAITTPEILYTDLISGPNSGGEENLGAYLSIFGKNFGSSGLGSTVKVYIGGYEVSRYIRLGSSKGQADVQQISVQVGAIGNPTPGNPLSIQVKVGSAVSNTDKTFIVNPGRIFYVDNVLGDDSKAVIGDPSHPFRYVQKTDAYTGGAWPNVKAGDTIVMRGHPDHPWADPGFEYHFVKFYKNVIPSAPQGKAGTGPVALIGYPNEDVFIQMPNYINGNQVTGGVSWLNGSNYIGCGKWFTVAGLRIDAAGWDGPTNIQIWGDNNRIVNNDLSATLGSSITKSGGIAGNGANSSWYGNHIHDIYGGSAKETHGMYIDGKGSYDIGYNLIERVNNGSGFQVYVNGGNGSTFCDNVNLHHNIIHDTAKHGINIADGSGKNFTIFNNLVYNIQWDGLRFNTKTLVDAKIFNNTFYNYTASRQGSHLYGAIGNEWDLKAGAFEFRNNIIQSTYKNTPYIGGTVGITKTTGILADNIWFGATDGYDSATKVSGLDSNPILKDPLFVDAPNGNFQVNATSPAIDNGDSIVSSLVKDDLTSLALRPQGAGYDLGCYELVAKAVNHPPVADPQNVTTDEDTAKRITLTATDPDGDSLTYSILTMPQHGSLSGSAANRTYTPDANYHGSDSFIFQADDGKGGTSAATISLTINSVNDAPVASPQQVATDEDTALPITLSATDIEGDSLTYNHTAPTHGTLTGTGANLTYTPAANFNGSDSFTFTANDGTANSNVATVSITVNSVNDAPTVAITSPKDGDTYTAGSSVTITADASDVDGTIAQVEFFRGDVDGRISMGIVTQAPYTFVKTDVKAGRHLYTVVATDNNGATTTSNTVTITVK
jgi:VCBS repeat-containing protein